MRRVLLVQPSLQPPGGGNGVAAWMLQALVAGTSRDGAVVAAGRHRADQPVLRHDACGPATSTRSSCRAGGRAVPDHLPVPAALMRSALLMRYTRRVSDAFDVIVGVHNETDYGRRGIQYVHYPTYLRPRPDVDLRWYHRSAPLLEAYYAFADRLADFSLERMKANLTLANSNWTAARRPAIAWHRRRTLYPPVVDPAPPTPWASARRTAFSRSAASRRKKSTSA